MESALIFGFSWVVNPHRPLLQFATNTGIVTIICEQRTTPEQSVLCHKRGPGGASTVRGPTWPKPCMEPSGKPGWPATGAFDNNRDETRR